MLILPQAMYVTFRVFKKGPPPHTRQFSFWHNNCTSVILYPFYGLVNIINLYIVRYRLLRMQAFHNSAINPRQFLVAGFSNPVFVLAKLLKSPIECTGKKVNHFFGVVNGNFKMY